MAGYIVTGKLGAGKGKFGVSRMRDALWDGRRVATNFDLFLDKLLPGKSRATAIRVPDRPTAADLDALGMGADGPYDEEQFGELHLDECASWLNARQFGDKGRSGLIDWLVHARKLRWHVFFYVQDLNMIDRQIREGLADYCVKIIRADRIKIPVIGKFLGKHGKLPRVHMANFAMIDVPGVVVDRDWFRGDDLHEGYDTGQRFREWYRDPKSPGFAEEVNVGPYSYLSAWHLAGRYASGDQRRRSFLGWTFGRVSVARPAPKSKLPLVQRLQALPAERRVYWLQRLQRVGLA
jgi:hypothetical protein